MASPRNPIVSICVPTYNGARHLRPCLESALAQTFGDFELLVVDDGSSDETLNIARDYCAVDSRVRIVEGQSRSGLPGNWNRCLEKAAGEWIKFLFQDDTLALECLSGMLAEGRRGSQLVTALREFVFEPGVSEERKEWYRSHRTVAEIFPSSGVVTAEELCREVLAAPGHNLLGEPSSVLVHREAVAHYGLFNTDLIMICDTEYWTRIGVHEGFRYRPQVFSTFRVHEASASSEILDRRNFRLALDGLVLLHDMVFAPVYEPLRRTGEEIGLDPSLACRLEERAKGTLQWARDASQDSDRSLLDEWSRLVRRYPRIHRLAVAGSSERPGSKGEDEPV